ncbi:hypothetical protein ABT010_13340 [Streptomyces sp. NPDC002668]|uniref:hypothetical protein n=1 Tax=Streptomyces sp. NPDC002668 TaxID=3154422 RepID=UPI0033186DB1
MGPHTNNLELSPGDELGHDATPDCCDNEMTADGRTYTCGACGTVLEVSAQGLVFDIR